MITGIAGMPQSPHRIHVDTLNPAERSARMSRIPSRNTRPEVVVRQRLHALGYRYRLHVKNLPGRPDIVFPSRHKVIFIHGCFWHLHGVPGCKMGRLPKSRQDYWREKFDRNRERDERARIELEAAGWEVYIIWECEISSELEANIGKISAFLDASASWAPARHQIPLTGGFSL